MSDDDETIIVCMPTARMQVPVSGSVTVRCRDCTQLVWLSPSSRQAIPPAIVLCTGCAHARMRSARLRRKPSKFGGLLPGQLDELKQTLERLRDHGA